MMEEFGLSGYLAPDGEWFPCDYQEHCEKAVEIVKRYDLNDSDYNNIAVEGEFIKFGTAPWTNKEGCGDCHVFLNRFRMPTESQVKWLKQNLNRATDKQKNEVLLTFSAFYEIELELI